MKHSAWKNVKRRKKMTFSRQDSDTSYMSEVLTEMLFDDKLEEDTMNMMKKTKFKEVFKRTRDAGSEYPLG